MSVEGDIVIEATQFFNINLSYDKFISFLRMIKLIHEKPAKVGFAKGELPDDVKEFVADTYKKIEWQDFDV